MSELTSVAAPPTAEPAAVRPLDQLGPADLSRLTMGFYFAFWGTLMTLVVVCEALTTASLKIVNVLLLAGGVIGILAGAWRLAQVKTLGDTWRRRGREALVVAVLVGYLTPFFVMWRSMPTNLYMLSHALALVGVFYFWLALMCQITGTLGRLAGRPSLVTQAVVFGIITVVLLFPPFGIFAQALVLAARGGSDPMTLLEFWLRRTPMWGILILLLPFPLVLSLLWTAKDVVLERLIAAKD